MVDWLKIRQGLFELVDSYFFLQPIVFMYENAPRPKDPYIGLRILNTTFIGQDYTSNINNNGFVNPVGSREFTLEIHLYNRVDAFGLLEQLATYLETPPAHDILESYGMAYVTRNLITDATTLLDTKYEPRAILEVVIRYNNQIEPQDYGYGWFESVEDLNFN